MSGFAALFSWLGTFWDWILTAFKWILDGLGLILKFIFFTIFDGLLTVIEVFLSTIDISSVAVTSAAAWAGLPSQLIWLINAVGLPQGLLLLGSAYLIRLTINLIPGVFTRV